MLWRKLAAVAPIPPVAWGLPHATLVALKRKKKKKDKLKIISLIQISALIEKYRSNKSYDI